MKISKAARKMMDLGVVTRTRQSATVHANGKVLTVSTNPDSEEVIVIHARRENDISDSLSDYSAGRFFDNMKRAVAWVSE